MKDPDSGRYLPLVLITSGGFSSKDFLSVLVGLIFLFFSFCVCAEDSNWEAGTFADGAADCVGGAGGVGAGAFG